MALKATIFKADVSISDMDRQYYEDHSLVLAKHPSETEERLMIRLLAFVLHACDRLEFTTGLSTPDEPALWRKSLTGEIELWIDLGLPDERRIRKACGRSDHVVVLAYGGRSADIWRKQLSGTFDRFDNLTVMNVAADDMQRLAALASRAMQLQCSIDTSQVWISAEGASAELTPLVWKRSDRSF